MNTIYCSVIEGDTFDDFATVQTDIGITKQNLACLTEYQNSDVMEFDFTDIISVLLIEIIIHFLDCTTPRSIAIVPKKVKSTVHLDKRSFVASVSKEK